MNDDSYLQVLDQALELIRAFAPGFLVVSAGLYPFIDQAEYHPFSPGLFYVYSLVCARARKELSCTIRDCSSARCATNRR